MIGSILAIAGAVASGAQAIAQNQKKKQAEASAISLATQAKEMKMQNAFAGLQVSSAGEELALAYGAQADVSSLEALKSSPESAVGGVAALALQTRNRDREVGAMLSEKEAERDRLVATGQQVADVENFRTQQDILGKQIEGAQTAASDATAARDAAITGAISGVASGITGIGDDEDLDNKAKSAQNKSRKAGQVGAPGSFAGTTVPEKPTDPIDQFSLLGFTQ